MYEVFEHTADLGLRITADTLQALYEQAATGLFSLMAVNLDQVRPDIQKTLTIEGEDRDYLLFDLLNELLFLFETEHLLFSQFEAVYENDQLQVLCRGEAVDRDRHDLHHEVKAITYHDLFVRQTDQGWLAEVIVDI